MPDKKKIMEKKIILIVVAVLVVVLGIFIYLHWHGSQDNILRYQDSELIIKQQGETKKILTLADIIALGEAEIEVVQDTSKTEPTKYTYSGILLKTVLEKAGIDYSGCSAIIASAVDGFVSAIPISKVLEDDNVFLVYKWEGKPLGTREENGKGPLMIIIRKDQFSQNWCKYLIEVNCE
jgi:hypothetical protein